MTRKSRNAQKLTHAPFVLILIYTRNLHRPISMGSRYRLVVNKMRPMAMQKNFTCIFDLHNGRNHDLEYLIINNEWKLRRAYLSDVLAAVTQYLAAAADVSVLSMTPRYQ